MGAIYRREMKAHFTSGMGYAMIGTFLLVLGLFFWGNNLKAASSSVGSTLYSVSVVQNTRHEHFLWYCHRRWYKQKRCRQRQSL